MHVFGTQYAETSILSADVGAVETPMTAGEGMPRLLRPVRDLCSASPQKGAQRLYEAATTTDVAESGAFVTPSRVLPARRAASDPTTQAELLAWCREITGV